MGRATARATRAITGLAPCLLGACYMPVTHSPRVEPGVEIVTAVTLSYGMADSGQARLPNPAGLIGAAAGTRFGSGPEALGLQVTAAVSIWNGFMADAYLQAPKAWTRGLDAGLGAALIATPLSGPSGYLQLGRELDNGSYVFTTQAVSLLRAGNEQPLRRVLWQPTVAFQPRADGRPHFYFATLTFGPTRYPCRPRPELHCIFQEPGAVVAIGLVSAMRFGVRASRQPGRRQ